MSIELKDVYLKYISLPFLNTLKIKNKITGEENYVNIQEVQNVIDLVCFTKSKIEDYLFERVNTLDSFEIIKK